MTGTAKKPRPQRKVPTHSHAKVATVSGDAVNRYLALLPEGAVAGVYEFLNVTNHELEVAVTLYTRSGGKLIFWDKAREFPSDFLIAQTLMVT